jgi:hypothetical protein
VTLSPRFERMVILQLPHKTHVCFAQLLYAKSRKASKRVGRRLFVNPAMMKARLMVIADGRKAAIANFSLGWVFN